MVGTTRLWMGPLTIVIGIMFSGCGGSGGATSDAPTVSERWRPATELGVVEVTPYLSWQSTIYLATAMNAEGDTTVVFDNLLHFGAPALVGAHYDAGRGSWSPATVLVGGHSAGAGSPDSTTRLAMDTSGSAFLVWNQDEYPEPGRSVYASRFDAREGTWGNVVRLSRDISGDVFAHDVAADGSGGASVLFYRTEGDVGLLVGRYSGGWLLGPLFALGPSATISESRLAPDAGGSVLATWAEPGSGVVAAGNRLVSRRYSPNSGWGSEASVPLGDVIDPAGTRTIGDLDVAADGEAFLIWQDWLQGGGPVRAPARIFVSRFIPGTGWATPALLDTVADTAVPTAADPKGLQVFDHGWALAQWGSRFSRRVSGAWDTPVGVPASLADGLNSWSHHRMTLDAAGNVLLVGRDAATQRPSFATYVFGKGWSEVAPLDAAIAYDYTPFLVGNGRGRLALAWAEGMDFVPVSCGSFGHCTAPTRVRLWARFYE